MASHMRSVSLPSRPHSLVLQAEAALCEVRQTAEPSSSSTKHTSGVLSELLKCVEDVIQLPSSKEILSGRHQRKRVEAALEWSLLRLELCDQTRDNLVVIREHIQRLKPSLRRSNSVDLECALRKAFRPSLKKAFKDLKKGLKSEPISLLNEDADCPAAVKILEEATGAAFSLVYTGLSTAACDFAEPKRSKLDHISQVFRTGKSYPRDLDQLNLPSVQEKLQSLECCMDDLDNAIDCLFKHLIQIRVTLLNMITS